MRNRAAPEHDHHGGLAADIVTLLDRRRALTLLAGAGVVALVGCGGDDESTTAASTTSSSAASSSSSSATTGTTAAAAGSAGCEPIPEETAGPFPGDGTNGPDVLSESGVVRSDITTSIGGASGVAEGVPLAIELTVLDTSDGCEPLPGAAVYLWHCDREGRYSMYSDGVTGENYLRGVQEADSDGRLGFTSIFPGAYSGRWPHIHFEVYASLADATGGGSPIVTSQLALPEDACDLVYATAGYEDSVTNLARTSLESDGIFADGVSTQLASMSGTVGSGLTAGLTVSV